ncbi:hypothetical protein, partial [Lacticaseibacillus mingshuiensis]
GLFVVHRSPTSPLSQYSQRSKRCFQTGQMRFHVPNTEVNNPGSFISTKASLSLPMRCPANRMTAATLGT